MYRCYVICIVVIRQWLIRQRSWAVPSSRLYLSSVQCASPLQFGKYTRVATIKTRLSMFVGTQRLLPGASLLKHVSVTSKSVFTQISEPRVDHLIAAPPELLAQSCVWSVYLLHVSSEHAFVRFYLTGRWLCQTPQQIIVNDSKIWVSFDYMLYFMPLKVWNFSGRVKLLSTYMRSVLDLMMQRKLLKRGDCRVLVMWNAKISDVQQKLELRFHIDVWIIWLTHWYSL